MQHFPVPPHHTYDNYQINSMIIRHELQNIKKDFQVNQLRVVLDRY